MPHRNNFIILQITGSLNFILSLFNILTLERFEPSINIFSYAVLTTALLDSFFIARFFVNLNKIKFLFITDSIKELENKNHQLTQIQHAKDNQKAREQCF